MAIDNKHPEFKQLHVASEYNPIVGARHAWSPHGRTWNLVQR